MATIAADVTDAPAAFRILADTQPDVLILNAGAKPPMARLAWQGERISFIRDYRDVRYVIADVEL